MLNGFHRRPPPSPIAWLPDPDPLLTALALHALCFPEARAWLRRFVRSMGTGPDLFPDGAPRRVAARIMAGEPIPAADELALSRELGEETCQDAFRASLDAPWAVWLVRLYVQKQARVWLPESLRTLARQVEQGRVSAGMVREVKELASFAETYP